MSSAKAEDERDHCRRSMLTTSDRPMMMLCSRLHLPVSQQVLGMLSIADILQIADFVHKVVFRLLVMFLGGSYLVWLGAHNPERVFPALGLCHSVFTDHFIFRHIVAHFFHRKQNSYHVFVRI